MFSSSFDFKSAAYAVENAKNKSQARSIVAVIVAGRSILGVVIGRALNLLIALSGMLIAGDAPPRSKPADYPVHATVAGNEIGVEYLVRSIPTEKGVYFSKDYLVIEVAVFATPTTAVAISADQFRLRLDSKTVLMPQSPGFVAASLKYLDWEERPGVDARAGVGDTTVNIGGRTPAPRFPGDQRGGRPWPTPPVPTDPSGGTVDREPPPSIDTLIAKAALPEGPAASLVKGCLFFPYVKKTTAIKSLELIFNGTPIKLL